MRNIVLGVAFVATFIASVFDLPSRTPASADKAAATPGTGATAAKPVAPAGVLPARAPYASKTSNLFAARSWQPPPVAQKVQAPKAPPLPFLYLGKVLDGEAITVFVSQNALTHLLHKGDVLANYKVEDITPADMTLVYLPLNEKQRLIFGSSN
jgi:hypothetical protein